MGSLAHWYCPSCQAKVSIHQAECPHCKQSQRADSDSVSPPATTAVGTLACWTCKSCGSIVDVRLPECPNCKERKPDVSGGAPTLTTSQTRQGHFTPPWVGAISFPTALLGIVAFFMPWVQISCGPVTLRFSGYEIATGEAERKMSPESADQFTQRLQQGIEEGLGDARRGKPLPSRRTSHPSKGKSSESHKIPALWSIPAACAILVVLTLVGLPRVPTVLVSLLASSYLAYLGVSWESEFSDPANTGGILDHSWLAGYWASWVGLLAPMILAMIRPRRAAQRD